jgi:charged multivesicular body protein 2A
MIKMKTQLQAVSLRLQTVKSQNAMATAIKGVARAMVRMNQQIDIKSMAGIIMEFEKQSELLDSKEEMIGDAMDDMMDVSDEEAETENVVDQVLEEIGIQLSSELGAAPSSKPAEPVEVNQSDKELEMRLENLRRG